MYFKSFTQNLHKKYILNYNMKITLSKVSQNLCCGKLCFKENFDKKVMSKTPSHELHIRVFRNEVMQQKVDNVTGKTSHLIF